MAGQQFGNYRLLRMLRHRRTLVAALCGILLIVASSAGIWLFQHVNGGNPPLSSPATATANAHRTATAAANAYNTGTSGDVQFGFDAAHTNWNPYERVINSTNVTQLAPRWSYST